MAVDEVMTVVDVGLPLMAIVIENWEDTLEFDTVCCTTSPGLGCGWEKSLGQIT